ncbi:MAG: type I restriction-modification enzyme R subunit C-terminal domain-containing protein, partial [Flavobacteriaceae bacterium]|nr:type I restriction-modification enzyme R subunit C-terminal domain-containing protein [Flavobacteriaceae bacterium]
YDFVKAHEHFKDEEWDGEPIEPEPGKKREKKECPVCGKKPCECPGDPDPICEKCNNDPCVCDSRPRKMIKVKLSDHKVRAFDSMVKTSFWSPEGRPISVDQFVKNLFGDIPALFKDEEELRKIWSIPGTRRKLMEELSDRGYSAEQLEDLRKVVHGENSDLFDVLSYVAYHKELVPRLERAERAKVHFNTYNPAQQEFLDFVLDQYVKSGVEELDDSKLGDLLVLKYKAISDAKEQLGDIPSIRETFIGFQQFLYGQTVDSRVS